MPHSRWETFTIPNNTAVSNSVDFAFGERIALLETDPSAWTAGDICFQISRDGTNFLDITDITDVLVRVTNVAAAQMRAIADDLNNISFPLGAHKVRLRSVNTASEADVNQGGERVQRMLLVK